MYNSVDLHIIIFHTQEGDEIVVTTSGYTIYAETKTITAITDNGNTKTLTLDSAFTKDHTSKAMTYVSR